MKTLPADAGRYYWTEWAMYVDVYRRGRHLYTKIPGGVEVRVTPRIAGSFHDTKPTRAKR
jgi:hypothetical protein